MNAPRAVFPKESGLPAALRSSLSYPGKLGVGLYEAATISWNGTAELLDWSANINRIRIENFAKRKFPDCYAQLDGGDIRMMKAFLEPEAASNTWSLLGGKGGFDPSSEYRAAASLLALVPDAFGSNRLYDSSSVIEQQHARRGDERWFFINGICTNRELAAVNAQKLRVLVNRDFITIHNPTQGPSHDLVESALQKFTNINTEPVARAFLEIADAITDPSVSKVVVIAHSQGTIITGDVLDLIYCSVDAKYFDRTNMNADDFEQFMTISHGPLNEMELVARKNALSGRHREVCEKLELYMFANGASRMCYLDDNQPLPHIESFANAHDIVTRLGSLAPDEFQAQDLVRIHGPLFMSPRYGHLLNAHYLAGVARDYERLPPHAGPCVGTSVHEPVRGNPCAKNPKWRDGNTRSKFVDTYLNQPALGAQAPAQSANQVAPPSN